MAAVGLLLSTLYRTGRYPLDRRLLLKLSFSEGIEEAGCTAAVMFEMAFLGGGTSEEERRPLPNALEGVTQLLTVAVMYRLGVTQPTIATRWASVAAPGDTNGDRLIDAMEEVPPVNAEAEAAAETREGDADRSAELIGPLFMSPLPPDMSTAKEKRLGPPPGLIPKAREEFRRFEDVAAPL